MKTKIAEESVINLSGRDWHITLIETDIPRTTAVKVALDDARALFDTLTSPEHNTIPKLCTDIIREIYPNDVIEGVRYDYNLMAVEILADTRIYGIFVATPADGSTGWRVGSVPLMVHNYAKFSYITAGHHEVIGDYSEIVIKEAANGPKSLYREILRNDGTKKAMLSIRTQLRTHNARCMNLSPSGTDAALIVLNVV